MDLAYDLDEAISRENLSLKDVKGLRDPMIPGVPADITDKQLALFYNACDKDLDYTRKVIESYYSARKNGPELFDDRDPMNPKIQQCLNAQDYSFLPVTPDGYHVIFHALKDYKTSAYHFENAVKSTFMLIDACLNVQGPRKGLIILFDMKGVSIFHLMRTNFSGLKKFFNYLQECLPCKLHRIHVMNVVPFFDAVLKLVKPFMKPELYQMLNLHKSNVNMDDFYKNCIPKSHTPADYGGDGPSIEDLNETYQKDLLKMQEYFAWEEKQRHKDHNDNTIQNKNGK